MRSEALSFRLRRAETHQDLLKACQVRAEAYGHKIPEYRESMTHPDHIDASPTTTVFICEDKVSGAVVGTMRIQTCGHGRGELEIEKYVELPTHLKQATRTEVTRLAAPMGSDPFVRLALWKAAYLFCAQNKFSWIVMGVRKPALIKAYERMGAKDVFSGQPGVPLAYAGNLEHRIYALDIDNFYAHWSDTSHPLLEFMTATNHRDIVVVPPSVKRGPAKQVGLHVFK